MSIIAHCERNDVSLQCSGHLLPGTKATIDCHSGYVKPNRTINKDLICLETGKWSHKAHQCEPSCGRLPPDNQLTKAPWHVGIHFIHLHNCSGTIISEHTVISVAHCFIWDSNKTGIERWERYHVSAGKILRPLFEDTEEQKKQERKIQEVKVAAR